MKAIARYTIVFFFLSLAGRGQDNNTIRQIELTRTTRGFQEHVLITPDSVHIFVEDLKGEGKNIDERRDITPQEWQGILRTLDNIEIRDLASYPSPSMKRASDEAMHSTIIITGDDGKEYRHGFDNENPHQALRPLWESISAVSEWTERH